MPESDLLALIRDLERRVAELELDRQRRFSEHFHGGVRRVRVGLQLDGSYGISMWNASGVAIYVNTSP